MTTNSRARIVSQAVDVLDILSNKYDLTTPEDISDAAVGNNIVNLMLDALELDADISSGRIRVTPEREEEGEGITGLSIAVELG